MKAEIGSFGGAPAVFLDGKPATALMHWTRNPQSADTVLFRNEGVHFYSFMGNLAIPAPEGTPEDVIHANQFEIPEGYQAHPWNFLIPLIVMIVVTLAMGTEVLYGSAAGVLSAFILYLLEKKMSFKELLEACYDGVVSMSFVMILTVLAFAVQAINIDLGLADYVISVTQPIMKGAFLPAVVFLVCGVYAYATGCFWDLAAIILPIVVPLAQAMGVDHIFPTKNILSGAAFGSNTCLYGDGVIMCAQGCEIKSMDLMFATLPYATISAAISVVLYLICGFMMV